MKIMVAIVTPAFLIPKYKVVWAKPRVIAANTMGISLKVALLEITLPRCFIANTTAKPIAPMPSLSVPTARVGTDSGRYDAIVP